jgi:hypothetical protein
LEVLVDPSKAVPAIFPAHGLVALVTEDGGETWRESWRLT